MQSKFKLLALVLLSTTFFLTSCGDSASNPTTPSNQVTDNSTNKPSVPSVNTDPDTPSTPDTTIKTITIDANNFDAKYLGFESDLTISGYTFKYDYIMKNDDKIQFRNLSKSNSYLFNSTAMNLSTVVLNVDVTTKGDFVGYPSLYASSSILSADNNGTEITPVITDKTTYTYTIPEGFSFFKVTGHSKYAVLLYSMTINLK